MRIDILTLFPKMFAPLFESIVGRAVSSGKIEINIIDIREFSKDKHKKCDDAPFGGGAGMVMMAQPIYDAIKSVLKEDSKLIYLSPKGSIFSQSQAVELSKENHLILLCLFYLFEHLWHYLLSLANSQTYTMPTIQHHADYR